MLALKILPRSVLVSISFPWFTPLTAIRCPGVSDLFADAWLRPESHSSS